MVSKGGLMAYIIIRLLFVIICAIAGYFITPFGLNPFWGSAIGIALALSAIFFDIKLRAVPGKIIIFSFIGLIVGLLIAMLLSYLINTSDISIKNQSTIRTFLLIALSYIGLIVGAKKGEKFSLEEIKTALSKRKIEKRYKVLDTSVIIDGRIYDILGSGFLEGDLIVPEFVLKELQKVADSSDSLKRNRGRRGLDILQKMKKTSGINVQFSEMDFPDIPEVDHKLIELTKYLGGKIVTNDFNLNKIAQLRGVSVLNINELANALKPVVLPGESLRVFIIKEGKEASQGVAYLDDGTMVVVDNAKKHIGKNIEIIVTSVLQTTAGKMIFGRYEQEY